MRISSISDEDIQLLKAIKPFMSSKSKELLDMFITVINIFKPENSEQTLNIEALTEFLTSVHESFEAQKLAISNQDIGKEFKKESEKEPSENVKDIENLLNTLAKEESDEV